MIPIKKMCSIIEHGKLARSTFPPLLKMVAPQAASGRGLGWGSTEPGKRFHGEWEQKGTMRTLILVPT